MMSLLSCLLGNRPSKWLTDREKLLIFVRIFLLILACVQEKKRTSWCNFYTEMFSFVNLANEYLSKYKTLTGAEKKSYQNRLHDILKKLSKNQTYIVGGTWGQSWSLPKLFAFYKTVIFELNQNPSLSIADVGKSYYLPPFSYSGSRDPDIRDIIQRDLFGVNFDLKRDMCQAFPIIFKSDTEPLNVPPPVVSKPSVHPSANLIHLGAAISALNLATPRESVRSPPACDFPTPMAVTPREICTPRTQRLPRFSKWLLQALLSEEFLQFLQQQSQKSSSQQLTQMFAFMRMYITQYRNELLCYQNPQTINSFFQALDEYAVVKTALELYRGKPLDRWIDIRIVSESNEEDQKRFYEYFKMMIHLKVWLCNNRDNKPEFSAECDGKFWSFDEKTYSFHVSNLPDPSIIGEQARVA